MTDLDPLRRRRVRRRLLAWFAQHARVLPWRASRDPYPIWVSEVMLQQTQVATVVAYFERFLARFPDLETLAAADEHAVLQLWEGLGYYRRARDLHRAARRIRDEHAGRFPTDAATLNALPGFGRYTTNAVLSQAFDARLPILEANSQRVLCRLLGVRGDPKQSAVARQLWAAAEMLLPTRRVGDFNQALMELGALVCTPVRPHCDRCPLRKDCYAFTHGLQDALPTRGPCAKSVSVDEVAVILRRGDEVLLLQRPEQGRWGNMWEFPHRPLDLLETLPAAARTLLASLGFSATVGREVATLRHSVTRFHITMTALEARYRGGAFVPGAYVRAAWVKPAALADYPLGVPQRRIAAALAKQQR